MFYDYYPFISRRDSYLFILWFIRRIIAYTTAFTLDDWRDIDFRTEWDECKFETLPIIERECSR